MTDRLRRQAPRLLASAAAVAVLAAGGVLGWHATHGSTRDGGRPTIALAACEQQAGCRVVRLRTPNGGSPAAVVISADRVSVVPLAMAAPPAGRTYVLWQMPSDGGPIPVSEFRDPTRQSAFVPLPTDYADTAAFAISVESASQPPSRPTHVLAIGTAV